MAAVTGFQMGKANGADGSHGVNGASCGFQVTECRRRPQAQLPPNSNRLYAERLINLLKGRRVHGEDVPKMHSGTISACGEGSEKQSTLKDVQFVLHI